MLNQILPTIVFPNNIYKTDQMFKLGQCKNGTIHFLTFMRIVPWCVIQVLTEQGIHLHYAL